MSDRRRRTLIVTVRPLAMLALSATVAASPSGQQDLIERVNADLLSDVTSVRREARRQLASLLQASQSPKLALDLVRESVAKSYRHQLGVTTALSNTSLSYGTEPAAKAQILQLLSALAAKNKDPSLRRSLISAVAAVKGQRAQQK